MIDFTDVRTEDGVTRRSFELTVAGETVTFDGLLLERLTVRPPAGAGLDRVTCSGAEPPRGAVTFGARVITPAD